MAMYQLSPSRLTSVLTLVSLLCINNSNAESTRSDILAPRPITEPTTITSPGSYKLAHNIDGQIVIAANNVSLDLNNYNISGTDHGIIVNNSAQHVEIENGNIGPITAGNGIEVEAGCFDITMRHLHIFQCETAINITGSVGIVLNECIFFQNSIAGVNLSSCMQFVMLTCAASVNGKGFAFLNTSDAQIRDSASASNNDAGFYLSGCTHAAFLNCRTISNGISSIANGYNFYSENGYLNSFLNCISENATTTATAEEYRAAGFLFAGSEKNSSILNCIISNTLTSLTDYATAYGILLETSLSSLAQICFANREATIHSCAWTPTNNVVIYAGQAHNTMEISVYQTNPVSSTLTLLHENKLGGEVNSIALNKDGSLLAVAGSAGIDTNDIRIFKFDPITGELELEDNERYGATVRAIQWDSTSRYLIAGGEAAAGKELKLYQYNPSSRTFQVRDSVTIGAPVHAVDWTIDGYHIITGGLSASGSEVHIYDFDPRSKLLTLTTSAAHGGTVYAVAWSHDHRFCAIAGATGTGGYDTRIYTFDHNTNTLTLTDSKTHGNTVRSLSWSADDAFLASAGDTFAGNEVRVYSFSNTTQTLTLEESSSHGASVHCIEWSPNGQYLSIGGVSQTDITHRVLSALSSPKECLVTGNTIFNTKGNSRQTSTGIRASGSINLVADNLLYNNNINTRFN